MSTNMIFDFNNSSSIKEWNIVDDVVMGGKSSSTFKLNSDGFGLFKGKISLKDNGGFSSLRYPCGRIKIYEFTKIGIKLCGDGKTYQLRIKAQADDFHSYITSFKTSGKWQTITIPLKNLYPSYKGNKMERPNFGNDYFEEISLFIGNEKAESFKLLIDKIVLK